ncbi:MAG TPA: TonB-dependent receptor [Steroidobacteraceae bacterium]|nr:TonB-dependent receptor [Steroidobacteraceae bacterium]
MLLTLLCMSAHGADAISDRLSTQTNFDIPAQSLGASLKQLANQAGVQILFEESTVSGLSAPALQARQSVEQALRALLRNTGLVYVASGDAIAVRKAFSLQNESTKPPQDRRSRALKAEGGTPDGQRIAQATGAAIAGGAEGPDAQRITVDELEMVVVTGSRLKRIEAAGPSPVHVITRQEIDRSGAATVREVLNTVTQNANSRDESGNATFLGASTVQLRGLPLGATLILLNGRRIGASAAQVSFNIFDLSNVPLEAVERIEVLTDSASAIYGADAVGGAVNIILKQDFDGAGAGVRYGTSGKSDADERQASFTIGGNGDKLSGLLVLDYYDRDLLHASDRDLTHTSDFTRFGGDDLRSTFSYPANVYSLDGGPLPGLTSSFAGVPAGTDGFGLTPADFAATDGVLNLFETAPYQTLQGGAERKSVFASGRYRITPETSVFAEALYTHRRQLVEFPPEPLPFGQFGFFTVPANNPFNPFGVSVGVDYRFVELGPRTNDATTDFSRFVLGASGAWGRVDWEVYWLGDRDQTDVANGATLNSFLNIPVVQQFLDSSDPNVALNVFSTTGNNNRQTLAAMLTATATVDDLNSRASMAEAVVRAPLWSLPGGPMNAVLGVNLRREKVDFLSPLAGDLRDQRRSKSAFAELALPLVGPEQGISGVSSLELTGAVRHDDYDDFDSSTEPQFGLTWRPWRSLLLRASYGEAYKAPTPFQLFFPRLTLPGTAFDPRRGGEPSDFIMILGGNPDLHPEQGDSTSFGFIWEPRFASGLSVSMNAFRVRQDDFITAFSVDQLLENEALFPGRVVRGAPAPTDPPGFAGPIVSVDTSNINFGGITTEGLDGEFQYAFPPGDWGEFVAALSFTYIDEFEVRVTPGTSPQNSVNEASDAGYPLRLRGNAGLTWNGRGGWSATLNTRYSGSYTDYDGIHELPSQTLLDLQLQRNFGSRNGLWLFDGLEATLGVINLTDQQGEFSRSFAGYDYQRADIRGRFFYVNLKARF